MFTFHSAFDLYLDLYLDFTGRTYDYFLVSDQIKNDNQQSVLITNGFTVFL